MSKAHFQNRGWSVFTGRSFRKFTASVSEIISNLETLPFSELTNAINMLYKMEHRDAEKVAEHFGMAK